MERDRDSEGRARNNRPRDRLGRPLPRGSAGVRAWDESVELAPEQALATAQRMLEDGLPFQAHEVLESAWKSAPHGERAMWQGLAQLAVGVTHAARGNRVGARALLTRARDALTGYQERPPHHVAVEGLIGWIDHSVATLSGSGDGPLSLALPRLVAP